MWPRSKYETEIQAVCRFYIQFNHVYIFECVFAWSYAHIDIHNGFWYRCKLCLAVSMGPASFPKKTLKKAGPSGNSWCDPSSGSNDHGCRRSLWICLVSRSRTIIMMIILKTMMNQDYDYFQIISLCHLYIYIYTKYKNIYWCMQYIVCSRFTIYNLS